MKKILLFFIFIIFSCEQKQDNFINFTKGEKLYKEGENLIQVDNLKAYSKFQQALIYFKAQKDSSQISKSLIYQSIAQNYNGDILGSEATLVEALTYMKKGDESYYSVFGSLGNLKYDQKEYAEAEEWFRKALKENPESFDEKANLMNNISASEYRLGKYSKALFTLKLIDQSKISDNNIRNRIRENTIYIKWLQNNNYPAKKEFENLLNLKLKEDDLWGINSSYSHLAEITKNVDPQKSLYYAKQMLKNAVKIKSPEDRLEAFERIFPVDSPHNLKQNFAKYKALSDSIQRSRNDYRKNFAYIKYDSEKKEIENQRLNLKDAENQIDLLYRNISLGVLFIILIVGFFWYKKRKKRILLESENRMQEHQLRTSKKVHDVVANGIYQVMTKIENQKEFDKEQALDELEFVYEKSRDISYDDHEVKEDEKDFGEKISTLIASFKNDTVNTYVAGNDDKAWQGLKPSTETEIYQIIREMLVNMKKHSQADRVAFKFERADQEIVIQYSDNGIGMDRNAIFKNGLQNMDSRIEAIGGKIIFDTETEKGLKIKISFPVS